MFKKKGSPAALMIFYDLISRQVRILLLSKKTLSTRIGTQIN